MASNNFGSNLANTTLGSNAFTEFEKTYSAFGGCDIVAYMGSQRIATLQGITVSITREIMPIFTMGDPNVKAYTKGKRAIAGNLVFTQFDKHAILRMSKQFNQVKYIGDLLAPSFAATDVQGFLQQQLNNSANTFAFPPNATTDNQLKQTLAKELAETYALVALRQFNYADQVPPFNITLTMVNELGNVAYTAVNQVQLVNEGWGYTIDDLTSEAAFTFVARSVTPLDSIIDNGTNIFSNTGADIAGKH